jgi:polyisoprenoid-binding protein YceI
MFIKKNIVFVLALLSIFVVAGCTSPPDDIQRATFTDENVQNNIVISDDNLVPINPSSSEFEFQGYGPGKNHIGTFEVWDGFFIIENNEIVGAYGSIDPSTVKTDNSGLDKHLQSSDFFDVEVYPEINIKSKSIQNNVMIAELDFHGVKKDISFPVEISYDGGYSLSTEFILSIGEFGISYTGVNDEVRIKFNFRS